MIDTTLDDELRTWQSQVGIEHFEKGTIMSGPRRGEAHQNHTKREKYRIRGVPCEEVVTGRVVYDNFRDPYGLLLEINEGEQPDQLTVLGFSLDEKIANCHGIKGFPARWGLLGVHADKALVEAYVAFGRQSSNIDMLTMIPFGKSDEWHGFSWPEAGSPQQVIKQAESYQRHLEGKYNGNARRNGFALDEGSGLFVKDVSS